MYVDVQIISTYFSCINCLFFKIMFSDSAIFNVFVLTLMKYIYNRSSTGLIDRRIRIRQNEKNDPGRYYDG